MEELRPDALASYVVAWHNRHPLARRITAARLQSIGYVALPFVAPADAGAAAPQPGPDAAPAPPVPAAAAPEPAAGATLRERALARSRQPEAEAPTPDAATPLPSQRLSAVFSEDIIPGRSPRQVARWMLRHGRPTPPPAGAPLRRAETDPSLPGSGGRPWTLYALTVLVEAGGQRRRLLIGTGTQPAVLGARVWSRQRLALALAALACVSAGALTWAWLAGRTAGAPEAPLAAASAAPARAARPVQGVVGVASAPAPALMPTRAAAPTPSAAVAPPSASAAAAVEAAASAPSRTAPAPAQKDELVDVEAQLGRVDLPPIRALPIRRPSVEESRAAAWAQLSRGALPAAASRPGAPTSSPPPPAAMVSASAAAAIPPRGPVGAPSAAAAASAGSAAVAAASAAGSARSYAVATRLLRTRAEAEQVMAAMRALLLAASAAKAQVEIVAVGDDWRVLGGPFQRRADAEGARDLLARRGMRVQIVGP
jgi:hypothetical protein